MQKRIVCTAITLCLSLPLFCNASNDSNEKFAIVNIPVACLREKPASKAELSDQEIMGYTLKLLKHKENWCEVETEYGYKGWMTESSFYSVDEAKLLQWKKYNKIRITKIFATVYSKASASSEPIMSVSMNALLCKVEPAGDGWIKVSAPDGRTGFLKKEDCTDANQSNLSKEQKAKAIIATAKLMMGIPYLWGGKSSWACDCSGFSSTVFRANGINIGRDSRKQVLEGNAVDFKDDFSNVQPGDLLFFGTDIISHVGISLGGKEYIHQSGCVHINSFDPKASNYNESNSKKLKAIRRFF